MTKKDRIEARHTDTYSAYALLYVQRKKTPTHATEKGIHRRYSSSPNDDDLRICFKPRKYLALRFLPAIYIK